jgi:hypothetical protein
VREEEVLLINGVPVTLEGSDGNALKKALIAGEIPSCELLNQILFRAGILRQPVELETSLSVKTSTVTTEDIQVARNGVILDERSCETKENNYYSSTCNEIWTPVDVLKRSKQEAIDSAVEDLDKVADELTTHMYVSDSSCDKLMNRQNSICTESESTSSNYSSSSRPVSNISNASYDNIICPMSSPNNNTGRHKDRISVSCDSGNDDEVTLTSMCSGDCADICKTNTSSSIQTNSSFGCDSHISDEDTVDFVSSISTSSTKPKKRHHHHHRKRPAYLRVKPQRHVGQKNNVTFFSKTNIPHINLNSKLASPSYICNLAFMALIMLLLLFFYSPFRSTVPRAI